MKVLRLIALISVIAMALPVAVVTGLLVAGGAFFAGRRLSVDFPAGDWPSAAADTTTLVFLVAAGFWIAVRAARFVKPRLAEIKSIWNELKTESEREEAYARKFRERVRADLERSSRRSSGRVIPSDPSSGD